jgi:hypothetical protein
MAAIQGDNLSNSAIASQGPVYYVCDMSDACNRTRPAGRWAINPSC